MIELVEADSKYAAESNNPAIFMHEREHLEREASIAIELACRWGMVAAEPDGEDSSGRARLKLQSPEEVVKRATTVASLLMEHFRNEGLIAIAPSYNELLLNREHRERRGKR